MQTLRSISTTLLQTATRTPAASLSCRAAYLASTRPHQQQQQQHRTFIPNPFAGSQTLTATRTLQYPAKLIYSIISDVGSYSTFLPYCRESVVTKASQPALDGKTYPEEAKLVVGLNNDMSETFTSRIYCVPETIVEAVSGRGETLLSPEQIKHHSSRPSSLEEDASRKDTVLSQLTTRWTLRPYPYKPPPASAIHPDTVHKNHDETSDLPSQERTEVRLNIEFQFANPVYAALSSAAAPRVADKMIEAFEKRVKSVIEGPSSVSGVDKAGEGVIRSKAQ
ncbi:hypothetical protein LTR85_004013 [Meristemomyces frigidus]|nr:hypothetical protein LTR85_004013 [Meristemomyces frigidus]